MESLLSVFLLFLAAIVALITYLIIPYVPAVAIGIASAIALAAAVWWHWTQFALRRVWTPPAAENAVRPSVTTTVSSGFGGE